MTQTMKVARGDWVIDTRTGRPEMVADGVKLRQDVRENLSIAVQSNGFGTGLDAIVGSVDVPAAIAFLVRERITTSITTMQRLQDQFQRAQRPANERILSISSLRVQPAVLGGGDARTTYQFTLVVLTQASAEVGLSGVAVS